MLAVHFHYLSLLAGKPYSDAAMRKADCISLLIAFKKTILGYACLKHIRPTSEVLLEKYVMGNLFSLEFSIESIVCRRVSTLKSRV